MTGRIDGIVTDITGVDRLLEIKSCNHFSWQRFWNGELPLDYLTQCCLYLHGLEDVVPDLTECVLLMKNKNTAAYLEFLLSYDREADTVTILSRTNSQGEVVMMGDQIEHIVGDAFDKFKRVDEYIEKKTLPKRPYEPDHWRCEYCNYFACCWEGYEQEFKQLKTDAVLPEEFADTVRYYKELGGQASDIKKERDGIAETIKNLMKEADAREGYAGEYLCKITLSTRQNVDKSKIPVKILEEATTTSMSHRLTISQPKGGKK
jgi:hypothetical protein